MMAAAKKAAVDKAKALGITPPLVVGITVLTSDTGVGNTQATVLERAKLAKKAGLAKVTLAAIETLSATPHAGTVERLNRLSPSLGARCLLFYLLAQVRKVRSELRKGTC
jgi:transcriptional regulator with XRE-family HTH domain